MKREKEDVYLGIDLGGTKLLIGEVDGRGNVLRSERYPSAVASGADQREVMAQIIDSIDAYLEKYQLCPQQDLAAAGVGLVGRIDPRRGLWLELQNPRMETIVVKAMLSERYKVPCGTDNDVRSAAEAERRFGRAKGCRNYIYMNIGTGIGAAFVIDGHMLTGEHFCGGEVGHHVTDSRSEVQCPCGRMGCVEALASGLGLHNRAMSLRSQYPYTALQFPDTGRIDGRNVFALAEKGDALCMKLTEEAVRAVSQTLENLLWLADPEKVILGGGLVTDGRLIEMVRKQMSPMSVRFLADGIEITGLNSDYAGLIGAAAVGMRAAEEEG